MTKLAAALVQPETGLVLLFCLGLLLARRRQGRILLQASSALLVILSVVPIGAMVLSPLENAYPIAPATGAPAVIVVLSGGEYEAITRARGQINLADAGDRLSEGMMLARRFSDVPLHYVGRSATLAEGRSLPDIYFSGMGLDPARLVEEPQSRNTWENALFSKEAVPQGAPVILVTSAFHMPRAVGAFCKAGWRNIVPWPVDYRTTPSFPSVAFGLAGNLHVLNLAVREHVALWTYKARGRFASDPSCLTTGPTSQG